MTIPLTGTTPPLQSDSPAPGWDQAGFRCGRCGADRTADSAGRALPSTRSRRGRSSCVSRPPPGPSSPPAASWLDRLPELAARQLEGDAGAVIV
ncbi:hypothetical protein [Streptomyces sp. NPDC102409]|uniref:hypothetical protein n=1 Tax=Streptomyces sp. NPDC102409 TaxID=3366172 RepID=UPI0037FD13F5